MQKFWIILKLHSQKLIEYRADVIIWTLSGLIQPLLSLLIWLTLLSSGISPGLNSADILVYFLAVMFITSFTSVWSAYFINLDIISGDVNRYLIKPLSLSYDHLSWNVSEKIYKVGLTSLVIGIFCLFNIHTLSNFNLSWPVVLLSIVSLVLSAFLHFYWDLIIGIVTFWTHDNDFFRNFNYIGFQLFSGIMIPIVFLPDILQKMAIFLPFRYTISFPAEILLNKLTTSDLILGLVIQFLWFGFTVTGYNILYKKGIKIYQGFGS